MAKRGKGGKTQKKSMIVVPHALLYLKLSSAVGMGGMGEKVSSKPQGSRSAVDNGLGAGTYVVCSATEDVAI